jgi:hypothetical protein
MDIYHPNCGRQECVSLPFYQDNGKWHLYFFFPVFSQISFNLYMQLHSSLRPNLEKYQLGQE